MGNLTCLQSYHPGCAKPRSSHDKQVNSFQSKWTITLHFTGHVSLPFFHFLPSLVFTFQIYKELQSWMELNFHYANTWTGTLKDKINLQARQWKWHFSVDTASRMWLTVWLFQCLQFQFVIYLFIAVVLSCKKPPSIWGLSNRLTVCSCIFIAILNL